MASIEYYSNLDLGTNEIKNVVVDKVESLPTTDLVVGRIVTMEGTLYICVGTSGTASNDWKSLAKGDDLTIDTAWVATPLDTSVPSSKLVKDSLDGKVNELSSKPTAGTYTKITVTGDGLVSTGTTLAENDIPTLSISKTSGLQDAIDGKIPKITSPTAGTLVVSAAGGVVAEDSTLTTKLTGIAAGAQVNVLEGVQLKGSGQSSYSDLTIDSNKKVQLDLSGYALKSEVTAALHFKDTVATYDALVAIQTKAVGDVYNVTAQAVVPSGEHAGTYPPGTNFVWDGTAWDPLGGTTAGYVPTTREINSKPLSSDINIGVNDLYGITDAQKDAINSGITSTKVSTYDGYAAGKINALANTPSVAHALISVSGDKDNIVESGVTATELGYLSGVTSAIQTQLSGKQDALTFDNAPTEDSTNPVKSGGVYTALAGKVDKVEGKGLSTNDFTDAYETKLTNIAANAQVNVIETVKVNGSALTVTDKAVDITVPTDNASLTNGAGYQTASDVSSAIQTAFGTTYFAETALPTPTGSAGEYTYTFAVANVWSATLVTSAGKIIFADTTIGASNVVVKSTSTLPAGAKLRTISKYVAP